MAGGGLVMQPIPPHLLTPPGLVYRGGEEPRTGDVVMTQPGETLTVVECWIMSSLLRLQDGRLMRPDQLHLKWRRP